MLPCDLWLYCVKRIYTVLHFEPNTEHNSSPYCETSMLLKEKCELLCKIYLELPKILALTSKCEFHETANYTLRGSVPWSLHLEIRKNVIDHNPSHEVPVVGGNVEWCLLKN